MGVRLTYVISNLNHHNTALVESFAREYGCDEFQLVVNSGIAEERKKQGWGGGSARAHPYIALVDCDESQRKSLFEDAAIVILDIPALDLIYKRVLAGKLTFYASERWFKPQFMCTNKSSSIGMNNAFLEKNIGYIRLLSKSFRKRFSLLRELQKYDNFIFLAKGWVGSSDFARLGLFNGRRLRWGYFVNSDQDSIAATTENSGVLWIGRFINWKQPDLFIRSIGDLSSQGFSEPVTVIGEGPQNDQVASLCKSFGLEDQVSVGRYRPHEEVIQLMQKAICIVVTSNSSEGWGVVVNEAVHNSCAVVCSSSVGCVNYLIRDNKEALCFKNGSTKSLSNAIKRVVEEPELRKSLVTAAKKRIETEWSSNVAASRFKMVSEDWLCNGRLCVEQGNLPMDVDSELTL